MKNIFVLQFAIDMTEGQQYVKFFSPTHFKTSEDKTSEDAQFWKVIHAGCFP